MQVPKIRGQTEADWRLVDQFNIDADEYGRDGPWIGPGLVAVCALAMPIGIAAMIWFNL